MLDYLFLLNSEGCFGIFIIRFHCSPSPPQVLSKRNSSKIKGNITNVPR